jgi:hypothetical protein
MTTMTFVRDAVVERIAQRLQAGEQGSPLPPREDHDRSARLLASGKCVPLPRCVGH